MTDGEKRLACLKELLKTQPDQDGVGRIKGLAELQRAFARIGGAVDSGLNFRQYQDMVLDPVQAVSVFRTENRDASADALKLLDAAAEAYKDAATVWHAFVYKSQDAGIFGKILNYKWNGLEGIVIKYNLPTRQVLLNDHLPVDIALPKIWREAKQSAEDGIKLLEQPVAPKPAPAASGSISQLGHRAARDVLTVMHSFSVILRSVYETLVPQIEASEAPVLRDARSALDKFESDRRSGALSVLPSKQREGFEQNARNLVAMLEQFNRPPLETVDELIDAAAPLVQSAVDRYGAALSIKRRQFVYTTEYGAVEKRQWTRELRRFIDTNPQIQEALGFLRQADAGMKVRMQWEEFFQDVLDQTIVATEMSEELPAGDGIALERSCAEQLGNLGWDVNHTPITGDQGVDLIARKDGILVAIQCKNTTQPAGNSAVQEVFAGKAFYGADAAAVVSPNGFTSSARQLAQRLGVRLFDPTQLASLQAGSDG